MDFEPGDYVLLSTEASVEGVGNKLAPRWTGPFEVVEINGPLGVTLRQLGSDREIKVHAQRVRRFAGPEIYNDNTKAALTRAADLSLRNRYLVERIVDAVQDGPTAFKLQVRWLGYEPEDDTLEPLSRVYADVPDMVNSFMARTDLPDRIKNMLPGMREALKRRVTRAQLTEGRRFARLE